VCKPKTHERTGVNRSTMGQWRQGTTDRQRQPVERPSAVAMSSGVARGGDATGVGADGAFPCEFGHRHRADGSASVAHLGRVEYVHVSVTTLRRTLPNLG